jgi:hypothetical protein
LISFEPYKRPLEIHGTSSQKSNPSSQTNTTQKPSPKPKNKMQQKFLLRSLVQLLFYTALVLAFASQMGIPLLANAG